MSTHIGASREDISNIVLMPGDPMRAKMIAEKYLTNAKVVNTIRGMYGFTGLFSK
jgi:Purine-nucleoside phosphorylase